MDVMRFISLWERCIGTDGKAVFDRVEARYREPHRRYHGPRHIEHCLRQFDLAGRAVPNREAVELALWFHDVVYDVAGTPAAYNESRSAEFFVDCAGGRGAERLREDVCRLIDITTHGELPQAPDERFVVDIDLSSFGLPWPEFLRDSAAVRAEQPAVPDEEFFAALERLMRTLLARPQFCFTEFFRARHEQRARDNINRFLSLPKPLEDQATTGSQPGA